jgi:hypothetical protein
MNKISIIKKLPNGKWRVVSRKGKNLGTFDTKDEAAQRLKQVEFFKHKKAAAPVDLSQLEDLTYSSIMRELNKQNKDLVLPFMQIFKKIFDKLVCKGESNPGEKALFPTLVLFCNNFDVKLDIEDQNKTDDIVSNSRPLSKWQRDLIDEGTLPSLAPFLDATKESPYIYETDKVPLIDGTGPLSNIGKGFII